MGVIIGSLSQISNIQMKTFVYLIPLLLISCSSPTYCNPTVDNKMNTYTDADKDSNVIRITTPTAYDLDENTLNMYIQQGCSDPKKAFRLFRYYYHTVQNYGVAKKWLEVAVSMGYAPAVRTYESMQEWPGVEVYFHEQDNKGGTH